MIGREKKKEVIRGNMAKIMSKEAKRVIESRNSKEDCVPHSSKLKVKFDF